MLYWLLFGPATLPCRPRDPGWPFAVARSTAAANRWLTRIVAVAWVGDVGAAALSIMCV